MDETALAGTAAAQAAATILRARAEQAKAFQEAHARHLQTIGPLQQRQAELVAAREQERTALDQEHQRRDREIFERYRPELERIAALLREAAA